MRAPLLLFVYNRPEHTIKTLEYLNKNKMRQETDLFIFSDGYKSEIDMQKVREVREVINNFKLNGEFLKVTIYESHTNQGLANSIIKGIDMISIKYKKFIVLEDDLLTNENFLVYMNNALDYFEEKKDVWSISGYSINNDMIDDIYYLTRGSSWGWGSWVDRWKTVDWSVATYKKFKYNFWKRHKFNKGGKDLSLMLDSQMKKTIDSWAIRWVYQQFLSRKFSVYPKHTFIKNIGFDGSGTHKVIKRVEEEDFTLSKYDFHFFEIHFNRRIQRLVVNQQFNDTTIVSRIKTFIKIHLLSRS